MRPETIIIGNLGTDPEVVEGEKHTLCRVLVIVNHGHYDKNGQFVAKADLFSVEAWDEKAKLMKRVLRKGQHVAFKVQIQDGSYDEPSTGKRVFKTKFVMSEMAFGPKNQSQYTYKDIPL